MSHNQRWIQEEEQVLIHAVKQNPHNLNEAFKKASNELGRSKTACALRWYLTISPKSNPAKNGIIFMSISDSFVLQNRKCSKIIIPEKITIWKKLLKFLNLK